MKRYAFLVPVLLLSFATATAAAHKENISLNEVIQALENPFKVDAIRSRGTGQSAIFDFQGDFFQESRIVSLDRIQRGRGRVWVEFDRSFSNRVPLTKFRWDYDQPTEQEIVSDGRTLWVYLPENNQVIQSDIEFTSRARADDPMTFLTGLGNLSRDFLITWASPNRDVEGNYILALRPRRSSSLIQRLLIVVDRDAVFALSRGGGTGDIFPILSTTVVDPSGNTTIIEFSDIRVNRGIPDSTFRFAIPAGVEVIRPTGQEMGF